MTSVVTVHGHEALSKALKEKSSNAYVVFYADPDENSMSWCPDCRNADPVLRRHLSRLPSDAQVIFCYVGDRPQWKDQNNSFRTDPVYKLTSVPTVINMATKDRLVEGQCIEDKLVKTFFSNGEDSV
ncbi:thioredoxin domain-containing protein 17 [Aplysia californica]|uniref:Thioredoxin domain-containing protein 17 n=1 Tax=Aplysia californica TaxID=6500 RepID=A0ABM0JRA7_APLCA|nr:thioredoxin domain-containing protein 17 [Aplysia californica]